MICDVCPLTPGSLPALELADWDEIWIVGRGDTYSGGVLTNWVGLRQGWTWTCPGAGPTADTMPNGKAGLRFVRSSSQYARCDALGAAFGGADQGCVVLAMAPTSNTGPAQTHLGFGAAGGAGVQHTQAISFSSSFTAKWRTFWKSSSGTTGTAYLEVGTPRVLNTLSGVGVEWQWTGNRWFQGADDGVGQISAQTTTPAYTHAYTIASLGCLIEQGVAQNYSDMLLRAVLVRHSRFGARSHLIGSSGWVMTL